PYDFELAFRDGPGLAFESDLFGVVPCEQPLHRSDEMRKLPGGNVRRSSASKVDEFRFSPADERLSRIESQLLDGGIQISLNLGGILVCIDFEIAEVAALAAERNV